MAPPATMMPSLSRTHQSPLAERRNVAPSASARRSNTVASAIGASRNVQALDDGGSRLRFLADVAETSAEMPDEMFDLARQESLSLINELGMAIGSHRMPFRSKDF